LDATKDPRFAQNPYVVADPHVRFYAGIPLVVSEGVALGTLCVIDMKPRQVQQNELELLKSLAAVICDELALNKLIHDSERDRNELAKREAELAALNASLEEKVELRTKALQEAQSDILTRLGRAAAFRDNDTNQHVQRMSLFCEYIAREFGMAEPFCRLMRMASPLHDIGKIGVPDSILHKPGSLTPDEMEKMKQHVELGRQLLGGGQTDLIQLAELIAYTHHERWDGTGYPRRLAGTAIPLPGRIAAIADVFDALTTERPYKQAWPLEKAVEEIKNQSGKQFDPDLVEAFLKALPKLQMVCAESPNTFEGFRAA
jgi:putative two-component system response regulator